ncbi:hypothetical protein Tco_0925685 [Tanacetum coccineum]|uniref:Uncharacterized protein n=1 Tax=Tanacetum coccineum TaxID=301880 RepID=A0ABQ5DAJ8_9ASTR
MPLSDKTILDSHCFVHELKTEMHDDLEYVKFLEKEVDQLESEKADFSNIYDLLLEECLSKDVICSYLHSLSDLNAHIGLQCLYLYKVKECECLAQKLSKQTESVNKEVHNNLLKSFSKLEKHSISLELALQQYTPTLTNGCKPKPRNWQASMSSRVSNKDVHLGEHRKQKPFLKFNDLQCPTCKKCLYSANHDECILEYLSRLNPRASAQNKDAKSHKTTKRYMPVEKSSASKKPERQIPTGHRFSNKKTTTVPEKTMNPRSCLRWKPTGRIFSNVHLRWIPIGKLLNSCTGKVDSEPAHGSIVDIPHIHACKQTLGLSAETSARMVSQKMSYIKWRLLKITLQAPFLNVQMMSDHNSSDLAPQRQEMSVENVSSGLVPQGQKASDYDNSDPVPPRQNVVPSAEKTDSSQQGLEFLFSPLLEEYYNPTHGLAEENNNDQAPNASFQEDEFINPFCNMR